MSVKRGPLARERRTLNKMQKTPCKSAHALGLGLGNPVPRAVGLGYIRRSKRKLLVEQSAKVDCA